MGVEGAHDLCEGLLREVFTVPSEVGKLARVHRQQFDAVGPIEPGFPIGWRDRPHTRDLAVAVEERIRGKLREDERIADGHAHIRACVVLCLIRLAAVEGAADGRGQDAHASDHGQQED